MTTTPQPARPRRRRRAARARRRRPTWAPLAAVVGVLVCAVGLLAVPQLTGTATARPASSAAARAVHHVTAHAEVRVRVPVVLPKPPASPSPTAAPTPTLSAGPGGIAVGPTAAGPSASGAGAPAVGTGKQGSPGLFDISGHITAAINDWFRGLVTSALTPVLALLGRSLLATPALTGQSRIAGLWQLMAGIADSLLVLLVLAGGAIVMAHETLQTRTAAKDIAPRIVVAAVAANASLAICGLAISLADTLSQTALGQGGPATAGAAAGKVLSELVVGSLSDGGIFLVLLAGVVVVLAVVLLATWVIRLALLVLLVVAAPLALICHALPQTEGAARLWWRAFGGCLAVQLGQSLVLVTALRVFLGAGGPANLGLGSSGGLVDLLVAACLCWVLIRIPSWVGRAVFGASRGGGGHAVRDLVIYKALAPLKAAKAISR